MDVLVKMQQYIYFQPQILTDQIFIQYGGNTGTSTAAQRQAAYLLAEEQMTEHLSSFLVPTVITGTVFWRGNFYETEFGHVTRVLLVTIKTIESVNPVVEKLYTGSALTRNAEYGYFDIVNPTIPYCYSIPFPYSVSMVYESGLSTGTVTQPSMLAALSLAAQINLNEWDVSLANEGNSDIGIQDFQNQSYREMRVKLGRSAFGTSPAAQRVARLVKKYRTKPGTGLR